MDQRVTMFAPRSGCLVLIACLLSASFITGLAIAGSSDNDSTSSPSTGSRQLKKDDINKDGYPDIIISNFASGISIYWGSSTGFSNDSKQDLPADTPEGTSVADLNKDGFNDIVVSNNGGFYNWDIDSNIYWGSSSGFSQTNTVSLPTHGASGNAIADVDYDGWLDVIFCNAMSGDWVSNISSYVYFGSPDGFSVQDRLELPTIGAYDVKVMDLNKDGFIDLTFANEEDADDPPIHTHQVDSYVYWGSATGYSTSKRTDLPTWSASDVEAADFDQDGYIDLVFSMGLDSRIDGYSYIYWGTAGGFNRNDRSELPTSNPQGVITADFNNDFFPEIVFPSYGTSRSYLYWGSASRFSATNRLEIPTRSGYHPDFSDLDLDGNLDIMFAEWDEPYSSIFWGKPGSIDTTKRTFLKSTNAYAITIVGGKPAPEVPDLSITVNDITFSDETPVWGTQVNFTIKVWNLGERISTKEFLLRVKLNGDIIYGDRALAFPTPGNFTSFNGQCGAITEGKITLIFTVDPNNWIVEKRKDNNEVERVLTVLPTDLPDLAITVDDISFSRSPPIVGSTIYISAVIHNIGTRDANEVVVRYLDNGTKYLPVDVTIGKITKNGGFFLLSNPWVPATSGIHVISVVLDPEYQIKELNETNNNASRSIDIFPNVTGVNHPPRFISEPPVKATGGVKYTYDSDAVDDDGDIVAYSLISKIKGMTIDDASGLVAWTPMADQIGEHLVQISASDGKGGTAQQAFVINVTYRGPWCKIDHPLEGQTVKGNLPVNGTVYKGSLMITYNQVRLDAGPWQKVIGLAGWVYVIHTMNLTNGLHKVEAQAFDSLTGSNIVSVNFTVYNPPPPPPPDKVKYKTHVEGFPWFVVATCIIATSSTIAFRYHKERKGRSGDY